MKTAVALLVLFAAACTTAALPAPSPRAPASSAAADATAMVPTAGADMGSAPVGDMACDKPHWWECQNLGDLYSPPNDMTPTPGCGKLDAVPCPGELCDDGLMPVYADTRYNGQCGEPRASWCTPVADCGHFNQAPCGRGCDATDYFDPLSGLCQSCP